MNVPDPNRYYKKELFSSVLNGEQISFFSKRGIPNWNIVAPQTRLLAETIQLELHDSAMLLGCGNGPLAVYISRSIGDGKLSISDHNVIALDLTRETLEINNIQNACIYHETNSPQSKFDQFSVVVIDLQKGRQLTRRMILDGYQSLIPGGRLYLGGSTNLGIKSAIKDAEALFGNSRVLGYRKGTRVATFFKQSEEKPLPGWTSDPGIQLGTWYSFDLQWVRQEYKIHSLPGVFSYTEIDEGTALLLINIEFHPGTSVLDIGCGYGIIGFVASLENAASVDLVDNNLLAVASTKKNFNFHGRDKFVVLPGDGLCAIGRKTYDLILSNPPFHAGEKVDYSISQTFFTQSKRALNPRGKLILVANRFIRYDQLLENTFKHVEIITKTSKYHIISAFDDQQKTFN